MRCLNVGCSSGIAMRVKAMGAMQAGMFAMRESRSEPPAPPLSFRAERSEAAWSVATERKSSVETHPPCRPPLDVLVHDILAIEHGKGQKATCWYIYISSTHLFPVCLLGSLVKRRVHDKGCVTGCLPSVFSGCLYVYSRLHASSLQHGSCPSMPCHYPFEVRFATAVCNERTERLCIRCLLTISSISGKWVIWLLPVLVILGVVRRVSVGGEGL